MAKIPLEEFSKLTQGRIGLLPLSILTKDGRKREVLDDVVTKLQEAQQPALLPVTKLLSGLVFTSEEDQEWLLWRFKMVEKLKDTWTYKEMTGEAREEGKTEGLRQAVAEVVQARFPEIAPFAQKQVAPVHDTSLLLSLLVKISTVPTIQEAIQVLMTVENAENTN